MAQFLGFQYSTPLTVASNQPEVVTDTLSLRRVVSTTDAQRWELQIPLAPDTGGSANLVNTVQVHREVNGGHTAFQIAMPQPLNTDVTSPAPIAIFAPASAGDNTVTVGSTAAFNIPAGRFITFGTAGKVYRVTQTATSAGLQNIATLNIFPALITGVANGIVVTHDGVNMQARHDVSGGLVSYTLTSGIVDRLTIGVIEAL